METITIALAQLRSTLFDKESNIERVLDTMSLASKKQANYLLFPELYITGYFLEDKVIELAEPVTGAMITRIRTHAKNCRIGVIVGFPEREGELVYNSAVFIDHNGEILGTYRKNHLFDHEKKHFTPGQHVPVFDTPDGRFGIMITYDMEFPEIARILAMKGAQLLLILNSNMIPYQPYQNIYLRARAMENHVFVAATNKVGLENDSLFFGESEVIHPTGTTIYKSSNNEDLAIVQISLAEINESKGVLDYIANRRSDLYRREGL